MTSIRAVITRPDKLLKITREQSDQKSAVSEEYAEQKTVIAGICAGAPSDAVRNCLRKYDPSKTAWQIERDIKKEKKETMVAALEYLEVPNMKEYRSEALPHELVCRIQNLLPDNCGFCKQSYCITLGDKPILSCVKCGQGCHNSCVLQILGTEESDLNEGNKYGENIANPYSTLGLFYICHECQKDVIPQRDNLRLRNSGRRNSEVIDAQADTSVGVQVNHGNSHASGTNNVPQVTITAPEDNRSQVLNNSATSPIQQIQNAEGTPTLNNNQPICKHYRTGRCKYGISGKKDGTCAYRHPKACTKLLNNGLRRRGGCNRGENCRFFHPQMCHASLQDRVCLRENCKFMHVRGTRRSDREEENAANLNSLQDNTKRNFNKSNSNSLNISSNQRNNYQTANPPPANATTFLDSIKALQDQMVLLTTRMQQMEDSKWQWGAQQFQGYHMAPRNQLNPQPIYPYQMPHPQMLHPPPAPGGSGASPAQH